MFDKRAIDRMMTSATSKNLQRDNQKQLAGWAKNVLCLQKFPVLASEQQKGMDTFHLGI